MKRRQIHRRDPERVCVVGAENPDDITMQSLNNSLAEDYPPQPFMTDDDVSDSDQRIFEQSSFIPPDIFTSDDNDNDNEEDIGTRDDMHFLHNYPSEPKHRGRARFNTHIGFLSSTNSGAGTHSNNDDGSSPRADLNWRKFSNGSVHVVYRK